MRPERPVISVVNLELPDQPEVRPVFSEGPPGAAALLQMSKKVEEERPYLARQGVRLLVVIPVSNEGLELVRQVAAGHWPSQER